MLEDLRKCLLIFHKTDTCGKIIIGIIAILIVGGIMALFILVVVLPNAAIPISSLLTAVAGFLTGRASK